MVTWFELRLLAVFGLLDRADVFIAHKLKGGSGKDNVRAGAAFFVPDIFAIDPDAI
jgi:hypothetical protein